MKKIKVYKEIQSTSIDALLIEYENLKIQGWVAESEIYIDRSKGLNSKKYKMNVLNLSREVFC